MSAGAHLVNPFTNAAMISSRWLGPRVCKANWTSVDCKGNSAKILWWSACAMFAPIVPTNSVPGLNDFAAVAIPEISPPPPIGTTKTSSACASATISTAMVPWPAITAASSYG
jgi:hypothetical protein